MSDLCPDCGEEMTDAGFEIFCTNKECLHDTLVAGKRTTVYALQKQLDYFKQENELLKQRNEGLANDLHVARARLTVLKRELK